MASAYLVLDDGRMRVLLGLALVRVSVKLFFKQV